LVVPEEVAKMWAQEWAKEGREVDWQRFMPPGGFRVLPRRWVVVRTFAWISHNRRMAKDYERLGATSEAFVYVAMTRLMVRRLTRCLTLIQPFWRRGCANSLLRHAFC
jgi:Transposase DDE domain